MKHAGKGALRQLGMVLDALREHGTLAERTPGSFYLRSKAFIHFHEDPSGLFADVKEDLVSFSRYRATTRKEQRALVVRIKKCLDATLLGDLGGT
jgi:hypothetical protein